VSSYIDLEQILRLQGVMGSDAGAIVTSMLTSMTETIEEVEAAAAAGDLDRVIQAAHRCRNDALALGARPLLKALTELETAGREYDKVRARQALLRVQEVWPPTRAELATTANPP
jgi:HPt (histidine-containing phosphotransfer) domain-containing protein